MRFSKEAKIGLLVTMSILVFFAGFYFLKGANLFSGENEYYIYYDNVQGLQSSASVMVKGLGVGRVSSIELIDSEKVKVTVAVNSNVDIKVGTVAELASADLLGTKVIKLKQGAGTTVAEDGSTLEGTIESGVIDNLSVEISPLVKDLRHVVASLDTVLVGVSGVLNESTANSLANTVTSLDLTMKNFSELAEKLNRESDNLTGIIQNAKSITDNLADNNEEISKIIKNAETTTDQLAAAPIQETINELKSASEQLDALLQKINSSQGTLGMMVNDKQLYDNLTNSLSTLNALMADINANPSRYINVTIFGKKKKN